MSLFQPQVQPINKKGLGVTPRDLEINNIFDSMVKSGQVKFSVNPKAASLQATDLRRKISATLLGVTVPPPLSNGSQTDTPRADIITAGINTVQTFYGRLNNKLTTKIVENIRPPDTNLRTIGAVFNQGNQNFSNTVHPRTRTNPIKTMDQLARDKTAIPGTQTLPIVNTESRFGASQQPTISERAKGSVTKPAAGILAASATPVACGNAFITEPATMDTLLLFLGASSYYIACVALGVFIAHKLSKKWGPS